MEKIARPRHKVEVAPTLLLRLALIGPDIGARVQVQRVQRARAYFGQTPIVQKAQTGRQGITEMQTTGSL